MSSYEMSITVSTIVKIQALKRSNCIGNRHDNGGFLQAHGFHLSLCDPWNSSIALL